MIQLLVNWGTIGSVGGKLLPANGVAQGPEKKGTLVRGGGGALGTFWT